MLPQASPLVARVPGKRKTADLHLAFF